MCINHCSLSGKNRQYTIYSAIRQILMGKDWKNLAKFCASCVSGRSYKIASASASKKPLGADLLVRVPQSIRIMRHYSEAE